MENDSKERDLFTEEEMASILEYGEALRDIHNDLVKEGYFLDPRRQIWDIFKVIKATLTIEVEDD